MSDELDKLRGELRVYLPVWMQDTIRQFEAMVRADAEQEAARLRSELEETHAAADLLADENVVQVAVIDGLRAQLDAANERNAALQTAAIDYWNAAYTKSPTGEAASEALLSLFEADAVTHTWDLVGDEVGREGE